MQLNHVVAALILSAIATIFIGVLAILHDPIPGILAGIAGAGAGTGAALSTPNRR